MDKKRIPYLILFLIVCAGLGFLIYWTFFHQGKPITTTTTPSGQKTTSGFPQAGEGGPTSTTQDGGTLPTSKTNATAPTQVKQNIIGSQTTDRQTTQLTNTMVSNADFDNIGEARFYNRTDGKFYRLDKNGEMKEMSDQIFYNISNVTWSPADEKSIIEYPDGSNIYFDFATGKQATLPKHWEDFSFSNQGDEIAAKSIGLSPENRWLIASDPEGTNVRLLEPMGDNADKVIVSWSPNKQVIALSATGDTYVGEDRQEILLIGQNKENFPSLIVEGRGMKSQWSPTGNKILYSVYSSRTDFKPELWLVNASGDEIGTGRKVIGLNTWADKCSFTDDRFVYCAVPMGLKTGAGFAPELANSTPDEIYKVDTMTGIKTKIPLDQDNKTIDKLFFSPDKKTLYFTDKNLSGLFSIKL